MAGYALKRLMTEYKGYFLMKKQGMTFILELTNRPPDGIIAAPIDEDNFFEWECLITGKTVSLEFNEFSIFFL